MNIWKRAKAVECPLCHEPAGRDCVSAKDGSPMTTLHNERLRAASRGKKQVEWFREQMLQKLQENSHKSGWKDIPLCDLLSLLRMEVLELEEELSREEINANALIRECADVANFAMMIADIASEQL